MTQRPTAPPPPEKGQQQTRSPRATLPTTIKVSLTSGVELGADRIVVYGTGGIGKSTLAAWLPGPVFLDLEASTRKLNVARDRVSDWPTLRGKIAWLAANPPEGMRSLVIDTGTAAEEFARDHVVDTRTTEKGKRVDSIEAFGWGKGWQFVYEEWGALLADLDRVAERGYNVCIIAHDVSSPVPNPAGEDWIRWEPHLYSGDKKGRGSIRERTKEWADHVLFVGYDVNVEDGRGQGVGSRTIFTQELPTHIAKSRTAQLSIPYTIQDPGAVWQALGIR